jgi:hypothetical protein
MEQAISPSASLSPSSSVSSSNKLPLWLHDSDGQMIAYLTLCTTPEGWRALYMGKDGVFRAFDSIGHSLIEALNNLQKGVDLLYLLNAPAVEIEHG